MLVWIALLFLVVIALWAVFAYNGLVKLREQVDNAWHQIDVQLKRRADLIPNLVRTVKGYMKHERGTLEEITKLRSQIVSGTPRERARANNMLTEALKTLFAVAENYPKLQASKNFLALQEELSTTENKIAYARQAYNDAVYLYNTQVKYFPTNILAGMLGFKEREYFEAGEEAKEPPKVEF